MKRIFVEIPGMGKGTLEGFLLDCSPCLGQDEARPAMIVCPGGGYVYCSDREGEPVAMRYLSRGFQTFVLRYSTGWDAAGFQPLKELSWAIGYLREHAAEWKIDPDKIAVCGFSAGGHLALASGLMAVNKPNAMVLGYPATCCPKLFGADFMLKVLVGRHEVTEEDAEAFDLVPKITKEAPPVFLMATSEDFLTPFGALAVAKKYSDLGMGYELHVFQYGPHGYSLATEECAEGSTLVMDPAFAHWHDLSVQWLFKTFGKPVFTDKNVSKMMGYVKELGL